MYFVMSSYVRGVDVFTNESSTSLMHVDDIFVMGSHVRDIDISHRIIE